MTSGRRTEAAENHRREIIEARSKEGEAKVQLGSGIPAAVTRAKGSLLQWGHGCVRRHQGRSDGMPRLTDTKKRNEGLLWHREGDGRRRKRSGRPAKGNRDGHRPDGQIARGQREDTGGEVTEDLFGQADIRRKGIIRVVADR